MNSCFVAGVEVATPQKQWWHMDHYNAQKCPFIGDGKHLPEKIYFCQLHQVS